MRKALRDGGGLMRVGFQGRNHQLTVQRTCEMIKIRGGYRERVA